MSAAVELVPSRALPRIRGWSRSSAARLVAGVVAYRIVLDIGYHIVVGVPFSYQGFKTTITPLGYVVSWLFLLALLPLLVRVLRTETLSGRVTGLLGLISLVPTTTLIANDPRYPFAYIVLIFVYWLLFLLACVFLPTIVPFRRPLRSEVPHLLAFATFSATILYVSWRHTGFRLHFGIFDVYDIRAKAREYQVATIIGYVATMADNTLPILLAYYLRRRWMLASAAAAVVILFNFGISATKQVIFLLVFAVASVMIADRARLNQKILMVLPIIMGISMLETITIGTVFFGSIAMHRLLFVPAHLHWVYYDFFQTREVLHLTQSALRFFFESPYRDNVQFLIGDYFIGEISARANNGLFSDGYMNFGPLSVLFYPILCVALLKLVEGAAKGLSASVQFVVILAVAFVFQGVPIPTAILTSGIGFLVILLSTLPRPGEHAPLDARAVA